MGLPSAVLNRYCVVFVVARLAYLVAYVADWALFRTLCWVIAYASCLAIYLQLIVS